MGRKFTEGAGILDGDGLQDFEVAAGSLKLDQADLVDGFDETDGAAIHDRDFVAVDFDQGVVDAETAKGGEEMLDGRDRGAVAVAKDGTKRDARHRPLVGRDLGAVTIAVG